MKCLRIVAAGILAFSAAACHRRTLSWAALAEQTGCTQDLLTRTPVYDSSQVRSLAGTYRLVQIDTARGWLELGGMEKPRRWPELRLWVADSLHAHSRVNAFTRKPMAVNRPVAGVLAGYEDKGFTADNPQVEVESPALDYLLVRFTPLIILDGPLWDFPIQRLGTWGFGGYFAEGSYVVPAGPDGEPLGQRAGFYCALRQ